MHCTATETVTARKEHRCTSCAEPIKAGEQYKRWVSFDDSAYTNKMHPECLAAHQVDAEGTGEWEYMPYSYPRGLVE